MPRPGEDRSDVGGAAQFNNIGPGPLSASCPAFRFSVFQCVAVPLVAQKSEMVAQKSEMVAQKSEMVAHISEMAVRADRLADGHKSLIPKRLDCVP